MTMTTRPKHGTVVGPWTPQRVEQTLTQSRRFVERAIFAIHYRQSAEQQRGEDTEDHDRIGFNRWDKKFMVSLVDQMEASDMPEGYRLSPAQLKSAVITLRRYAPQLSDLANWSDAAEKAAAADRIVCHTCGGVGVITENVLGAELTLPCPKCGDTPAPI